MDKKDFLNTPLPVNFIATFDQKVIKIDNQKSKARLRVFYKGLNRNNSNIELEFVEKLLKTLPGTPVIGEYDKDKEDFTQHTGVERTKSYGFVPPVMNFAWEEHEDDKGNIKEYACCDVILWTGRYEEANKIIGKKQSMEIDPDSIDGEWEIHNGFPYFKYTAGEFFGLCVLGDDYDPCFEESGFYALEEDKKELIRGLRTEYTENLRSFNLNDLKGGKQMLKDRINFKLSHDSIFMKLWDLVNPNYSEAGGWMYECGISCVYDDYALVYNYENEQTSRVYYSVDDNDVVSLGEKVDVFIVDVTKDEYTALQYIQELGTYAEVEDKLKLINSFQEKNPDFSFTEEATLEDSAVVEEEATEEEDKISAFEEEESAENGEEANEEEVEDQEEVDLDFTSEQVAQMVEELAELKSYKNEREMAEKNEVLTAYAERLDGEIIEKYTQEVISKMTKENLEKDLAYYLVKSADFAASKPNGRIPIGAETKSSVVSLLENYVRD